MSRGLVMFFIGIIVSTHTQIEPSLMSDGLHLFPLMAGNQSIVVEAYKQRPVGSTGTGICSLTCR